jgi:site-specific DNA recombinase
MEMEVQNKHGIKVESNPYEGREGLVYVRVSSKRQEVEGHGRESQEVRCKADLENVKVPYVKTFYDTYTGSGDFMNRPAMREMLEYIDKRPHKKFVAEFDDLKRFARDTEFHLKLRGALKARDVIPRCLNYNFDDSPEGMYLETILAAGNELERHQNRRQVIQKMRARLESGYWPFSVKRGYDMKHEPQHGKISVPNKEGLTTLKAALEGFATGNMARQIDVARFLVERDFWPGQTAEKCITRVKNILEDCFYCGDIEYKKWDVPRRNGNHRGIISPNTHELIQKRLQKDSVKGKVRKTTSEDFPMRSLLICSDCDKPLTAAWSKGRSSRYGYYYCQNKQCTLYSKMFKKDDIEKGFDLLLAKSALKKDMDAIVLTVFDRVWEQEAKNVEWHRSITQERIDELQKKVRELAELARKARSDVVRREYEKEMEVAAKSADEIEGRLTTTDDLGTPYRTALAKAVRFLKSPVTIWESVNVYEKQRLFFFLFDEKIAYSPKDGYRTAFSVRSTRIFEELVTTNSTDVDQRGLEPPASSVQMRRSSQLSYWPNEMGASGD